MGGSWDQICLIEEKSRWPFANLEYRQKRVPKSAQICLYRRKRFERSIFIFGDSSWGREKIGRGSTREDGDLLVATIAFWGRTERKYPHRRGQGTDTRQEIPISTQFKFPARINKFLSYLKWKMSTFLKGVPDYLTYSKSRIATKREEETIWKSAQKTRVAIF